MKEYIMQETEEVRTFGSVWRKYEPAQELVRCEDCALRGNPEKCIVANIAYKKGLMLISMLDNNGKWFCADGEKKK